MSRFAEDCGVKMAGTVRIVTMTDILAAPERRATIPATRLSLIMGLTVLALLYAL